MSEQPYMQLWIADFLGDTLHLSDAEIGQYVLLLCAMWRAGGELPNEPSKLARIARSNVGETVLAFFDEANGKLTQKRLLTELEKARAKSQARSEAGKAGAFAKALKNNKRPQAKATANAKANGHAKVQHSPQPVTTNVVTNNSAREELLSVLDEARAEAVIAHRKSLKHPLDANKARLLAKKLAIFPDANAAADEMIVRGWRSIEPEWLTNKGQGPPTLERRSPLMAAGEELIEEFRERDERAIESEPRKRLTS